MKEISSKQYPNPSSLSTYAIRIVVPIGIIILLATWLGESHLLRSTVEDELREHVEDIGAREAAQTKQNLEGLRSFAKSLAANDLIVNGLIDLEGRAAYIPIFFRSLIAPLAAEASVSLVDYRGRSIASNAANKLLPTVTPAMVNEGVLIIDSHKLLIVEPILLSGSAEGAIVINYPASTFESLFGKSTFPDSLFVVAQNGLVVYSTNSALARVGEIEPEASVEGWLQVRSSLPQAKLSVVITSSLDEAFESMEAFQMVRIAGLLVFLSVLIGLVLLTVFIVTRPLKRFTTGISNIKSISDLGKHLSTEGPREIAEIASTINRMTDWLQSTTVSRNYMDNIFDSVTDGIITIDHKGLVMTFNSAARKLFGYNSEEIVGQNVSVLMPSDERQAHDSYLRKTQLHMPRIIAQNRELKGYRKDGSLFPMELIVTPLEEEGKQGFVGTIRDITERNLIKQHLEQRSEELKRTNKELERFVYVASHDLKAPMRGIDNLATWIEQDLEGKLDEEAQENLTLLRGRVHRMEDLLDGLLEYSRVGRVSTKSETIDTGELVTDIVDLLALPKEFSVDMPGPMPVITTEKV